MFLLVNETQSSRGRGTGRGSRRGAVAVAVVGGSVCGKVT